MPALSDKNAVDRLLMAADELGVKLEIAAGVPTWEALPVVRHQRAVKRIAASIGVRPASWVGFGCVEYRDVAIRFADGSFKRPEHRRIDRTRKLTSPATIDLECGCVCTV